MRGATASDFFRAALAAFQSTHPLRGATPRHVRADKCHKISIHAPLAGCDARAGLVYTTDGISIHAPLAGCDGGQRYDETFRNISIHAPLAGCDRRDRPARFPISSISIHAPLAGCDIIGSSHYLFSFLFQSTHPLRGATIPPGRWRCSCSNFNPRTPCGVRLASACLPVRRRIFQSTHPLRGATSFSLGRSSLRHISIHAPLAGCDKEVINCFCVLIPFQSTHPLRGATIIAVRSQRGAEISIHAPLAGCDKRCDPCRDDEPISIHAPLAGCDPWLMIPAARCILYFNPRTPCGVRLAIVLFRRHDQRISIHAPLAGCDIGRTAL